MSFDFNYKFWVSTRKDIRLLLKRQNALRRMEPVGEPQLLYKLFSEMYVLYVDLVNKLGYCYHHTFQVQKRKVVRDLTESAMCRLMELKTELKGIELSEYVYVDQELIKRKLSPQDLVIWRSPNFLFRRPPEIQNIIYENKIFMNEEEKQEEVVKESLIRRKALILIQAHERARQARVYLSSIKYDKKLMKPMKHHSVEYHFKHKADGPMSVPVKRTIFNANFLRPTDECKELLDVDNLSIESIDEEAIAEEHRRRNKAAIKIQRAWRAHHMHKVQKMKVKFKETLLCMKTKRRLLKPHAYQDSIVDMYKNELFKKKLDEDFVRLMQDERTRLLQQRTPWIMEDISDHIRAWFREFYDKCGDFHPYPDALKTGTVLVLIDESMDTVEFRQSLADKNMSKEEKKKKAEKLKLQKQKEKEKRKKEKAKEAKAKKKLKDAGFIDIADQINTNKHIENIQKIIKQYSIDWKNVDEYLNREHEAIKEWVTEDELALIHRELRALVDEYMRVEYELLREALCKDNGKKYKPTKVKKPKNKKGKKKKTPVDLTADRTLESLFYELKEGGIIEQYKNRDFEALVAEFNFTADDTRDEDRLTTIGPAKGDIKMVVQECLLGMGDFNVDKPKSICLVGPLNNGKRLLCNIIASELDAVFINLSPERTQNWDENNLNYHIHVVMKVARAFQPTVLFIGDCHRVYWKKVPPDQTSLNPKLLQQTLLKKIVKPIAKTDRIMLIGTSDTPWAANAKMKKAFQKILLVPSSDYGTSFLLWMDQLTQSTDGDFEEYQASALAKVLQHYTTGDVVHNVASTLGLERRMHIGAHPVDPKDFLEYFLNKDPPLLPADEKIVLKYEKWFGKANQFCKMRRQFLAKKEAKAKKK